MRFGDFVELNPRIKLTKGASYPFVEMKVLEPSIRSVSSNHSKIFSGSGSKFESGDTLLARITPCLENGKTSQYKGHSSPAWGSTEFIVLRAIPEKSDNSFVYYLSRSPEFRSHAIQNMVGSSGRQRVPIDAIENYECELPPLREQKAIVQILGTLDDKIELNQQMNQTLEESAKAIFKSWFVDFDPVRAKAEGRSTGLPPEISVLFPDELVGSEIGEIPKGWEVTIVSGFGNVVCGKTPSTKDPENFGGEFPFVTIPDMRGNLISLSTERSVSEKGASVLKGKMLPAGSICVSCIATPGLVSITTGDSFTNQQINSIVPFSEGDREYVLFSMMTFGDLISSAGSGGSVFANLSTGRFKELPILKANEEIRTVFSKIVRPMLQRIELSQKEITTLSQLRDTLLPKLISGELRIPDAEKFLKEAGI
ncbi:restriction endonuclease subunit S [Paracoccaceae bacterium]|nr:restriction endonuclease subunit S [Paracoccaceae bacterium]